MSAARREITDPAQDRYATLRLIDWWEQERLRAARVMVVGAGALGNEALKSLALLGVGHLFVVDFDKIEAANLSRTVLFRDGDLGQDKAAVAARRLREINPDVHVIAWSGDVTGLGLGVYKRMDVVLGCVDNRAARLTVNRACLRVGVPWIDGGLDVLMGTVVPYFGDAACYECGMTEQDYDLLRLRYACAGGPPQELRGGRMPTTPTDAAIIAALQVQEAVKLLHGLPVTAGDRLLYDGLAVVLRRFHRARRADCPSHALVELPPPQGIAARCADLTVSALLTEVRGIIGGEGELLLDQEIVSALVCRTCQHAEPIYAPYDQVVPARSRCERCGSLRFPMVTDRVDGQGSGGATPLAQLGIAPLGWVQVVHDGVERTIELTGDEAAVLSNWGNRL